MIFLARQPIFDLQKNVFGYELLYRKGPEDQAGVTDPVEATRQVLSQALVTVGLPRLVGNKKALVNFPQVLLEEKFPLIAPSRYLIIEILEDVKPSEALLKACQEFKARGYLLALDDYVFGKGEEDLVSLAHILKVDFLQNEPSCLREIPKRFHRERLCFLAEKVETEEAFQEALACGYQLFQGFFFQRPSVLQFQELPACALTPLELMAELEKMDGDLQTLEKNIRQDPVLTYKLLKYINSAYWGLSRQVESVSQALLLLGREGLRKWIALLLITCLQRKGTPKELINLSLVRAGFMEQVAREGNVEHPCRAYLTGLFSLIDAIAGGDIVEVLADLPLVAEIKAALCGEPNTLRLLLELCFAFERVDQAKIEYFARRLNFPMEKLQEIYYQSLIIPEV